MADIKFWQLSVADDGIAGGDVVPVSTMSATPASNQISAGSVSVLGSGAFLDPTSADYDLLVRKVTSVSTLKVGFIGDSITAGTVVTTAPPTTFATVAAPAGVTITPNNQGVSGATSADWNPSGGAYYAAAKTAFQSAGLKLVHVMLGTNDSKAAVATTQAAYRANLRAMCDDLIASGFLVALSYPPFLNTTSGVFDASSPARILSYCAAIDSLVDNQHIFRGDTLAYAYFKKNAASALQSDGVHPTQAGSDTLAGLWAKALQPIINGLSKQTVLQRAVLGSGLSASVVGGVVTIAATGGGGSGTVGELNGINDQTGTSYTLALTDKGKDVRCTNAAAVTLTIPPNSSVAFPVNSWLLFSQGGAGAVTATAGAGVTLRAPNGAATTAQYDARGLEKIGADEWRVW